MIEIRYMQMADKEFWYSLDKHLPEEEFQNKVRDKRGYILLENNKHLRKWMKKRNISIEN